MPESKYVQHPNSVWGDRVNFIAHIEGPYDDDLVVREQVGTRQISPDSLELCSLPFYVYGYSLGDVLQIDPETFRVLGVSKKSGRYLFRVLFKCSNSDVIRIADHCEREFGALFEWLNSTFCVVDIESAVQASGFRQLMDKCESEGLLSYETGTS